MYTTPAMEGNQEKRVGGVREEVISIDQKLLFTAGLYAAITSLKNTFSYGNQMVHMGNVIDGHDPFHGIARDILKHLGVKQLPRIFSSAEDVLVIPVETFFHSLAKILENQLVFNNQSYLGVLWVKQFDS